MLMELFQRNPSEVYDIKRIFSELKLTTHPSKLLCMDLLEDLTKDDYIKEAGSLHFQLNTTGQVFEAIFNRKANGKNTVSPLEGGEPVFVAERNSLHAMDGDKVKVSLLARRKHHLREAQVVEILKRSDKTFVGRLEVRKDFAFLVTENRTLANDIFIPKGALHGGKNGDKAVVKITEWPDSAKNPIGKVVDILGKSGENTTEMHAILAEYGLPYSYPKEVEKEADKIEPGSPYADVPLVDLWGRSTALSGYVGYARYVVIGFWQSGSAPSCRAMVRLGQLYKEYGYRGATFLFISLDADAEQWRERVQTLGLPAQQCIAAEPEVVESRYALASVPAFVVINPDGSVNSRNLTVEQLESKLKELLPYRVRRDSVNRIEVDSMKK